MTAILKIPLRLPSLIYMLSCWWLKKRFLQKSEARKVQSTAVVWWVCFLRAPHQLTVICMLYWWSISSVEATASVKKPLCIDTIRCFPTMKCTAGEHEFFSGVIVCTHSASTRIAVQSGIKHFHTLFHGSGSLSGSLGILLKAWKIPWTRIWLLACYQSKRTFNIII